MYQLVVFDVAGTTVHDDDSVGTCFKSALHAVGIIPEQDLVNQVMGLPKLEAIKILADKAKRILTNSELLAVHEDFRKRMCNYYHTSPQVRPLEGAESVFKQLRSMGIKVALNTGFDRQILDQVLMRLGWSSPEVIDTSIASDEVAQGRPMPDMIRKLMQLFQISDSKQVIKIGDTWVDLEEGHNAVCGLNFGVTSGAFTREKLRERPHTAILDSIVDLVPYIRNIPKGCVH